MPRYWTACTRASPIPTIVKDRRSVSAEWTELQTGSRVLQLLTQGCYPRLRPTRLPPHNQDQDNHKPTVLVSARARDAPWPCNTAFPHAYRPWDHKHFPPSKSACQFLGHISSQHFLFPSIYEEVPTSKYKTRANGNRVRNKLTKSSAHPNSRLLGLREDGNVARGDWGIEGGMQYVGSQNCHNVRRLCCRTFNLR